MTLTNPPHSGNEENNAHPDEPGELAVLMVVMIIADLFWLDGFVTAFTPVLAPLLGR